MENQKQTNNVEKWQKLDECTGLRVKSVKPVGKKKVYDISVADSQHYILENGVVTHNTGIYYSADNIYIIGRQQEKDGTELTGYNFIINVEKSRHVKEKAKIPIEVRFEGGISTWSGLLDIALESGHVIKPKNGWYQKVDMETGEIGAKNYRRAETDTKDFWLPVLKSKSFRKYIEDTYMMAHDEMVTNENLNDIYGEEDA